jgi:hypothetical protein
LQLAKGNIPVNTKRLQQQIQPETLTNKALHIFKEESKVEVPELIQPGELKI